MACVQYCPSSYYGNTATMTCENCPSGCESCSDGVICLSCQSEKFDYLGNCLDSCPYNTFEKELDCEPCLEGCLGCQDSTMLTCQDGCDLNLGFISGANENECIKLECSQGFVLLGNICEPCDTSCLDCSGTTNSDCKTCNLGFIFNETVCTLCSENNGLNADLDGNCIPTCGDEILQLPEECDDGNMISKDGCDSSCHIEYGYDA